MWSNELCEDIPVNFLFGRVKDDPTAQKKIAMCAVHITHSQWLVFMPDSVELSLEWRFGFFPVEWRLRSHKTH